MVTIRDDTLSNADHPDLPVAAQLDAGADNCSTLILNVRHAMQSLAPGDVLEIVAYDPSAQLDLEAWSRMTGHPWLGTKDCGDYAIYHLRKRGG